MWALTIQRKMNQFLFFFNLSLFRDEPDVCYGLRFTHRVIHLESARVQWSFNGGEMQV